MKPIIKHIVSQPFIASTAFAALLHSTWALGTLFAGVQPPAGFNFEFIGWLAPALLIAFSLDIGLLATAGEIRSGQRTKAKYLTFGVLSMSMFYLQWVYLIAHTPAVNLSAGVSPTWQSIALTLRDLGIWIIPGLLPLSTLLYTFSHSDPSQLSQPASRALAVARGDRHENRDERRAALVQGMIEAPPEMDTVEAPAIESPNGHAEESTRPFLSAITGAAKNRRNRTRK